MRRHYIIRLTSGQGAGPHTVAPFDCPDREADYRGAWASFERSGWSAMCAAAAVVLKSDRKWRAMKTTTYEATVENGQIKLLESADLPEHTRVFVVVPGVEATPTYRVSSPRLAHPEQVADFIKEVVEEPRDAGIR